MHAPCRDRADGEEDPVQVRARRPDEGRAQEARVRREAAVWTGPVHRAFTLLLDMIRLFGSTC